MEKQLVTNCITLTTLLVSAFKCMFFFQNELSLIENSHCQNA